MLKNLACAKNKGMEVITNEQMREEGHASESERNEKYGEEK